MPASQLSERPMDPCTIFVHAGAGFHSYQNEGNHLEACNAAAAAGMHILRNGGSAVDAVEMAVKVLEDREITNAGYGSNLTLDGIIECDATIVDHLGRSGAVGAVPNIRNPISLARVVLDHSLRPMSLKRVPPNLLVSQGAVTFAHEMGMPITNTHELISSGAKERWNRWRQELVTISRAEPLRPNFARRNIPSLSKSVNTNWSDVADLSDPWETEEDIKRKLEEVGIKSPSNSSITTTRSNGSTASLAQSQADTPGPRPHDGSPVPESPISSSLSPDSPPLAHKRKGSRLTTLLTPSRRLNVSAASETDGQSDEESSQPGESGSSKTGQKSWRGEMPIHTEEDGPTFVSFDGRANYSDEPDLSGEKPPHRRPSQSLPALFGEDAGSSDEKSRNDFITDTVGAIAVDSKGRIAAASSSGGIGMKHRGRIGPAALVGIGTAVVPTNPLDQEQSSVAVVTSGTGEHMATTMASSICAERLYTSTVKKLNGTFDRVDEDTALHSFIANDFMSHPGVKQSLSMGAIGTLAIKLTADRIIMLYAHNTDSFAIASMHSNETRPQLTMSRNKGNGDIAFGGREVWS